MIRTKKALRNKSPNAEKVTPQIENKQKSITHTKKIHAKKLTNNRQVASRLTAKQGPLSG